MLKQTIDMQILHAVNAKHLNTSLWNGTEDKHYCIKHDIDFYAQEIRLVNFVKKCIWIIFDQIQGSNTNTNTDLFEKSNTNTNTLNSNTDT